MKKLILILLLHNFCCVPLNSQTLKPVERSFGKLNISVDPRFELLLSVQSLSNHTRVNRNLQYSKDALNYFKPFSSHEAVILTDTLSKYFWADDPINFMLCLSQPYELKQKTAYPDNLIGRKGEAILEQYRKAFKDFAEVSDFKTFWYSKQSFYNKILDFTTAEAGDTDLTKVLEDYFNQTNESYDIIIIPAFEGGIGTSITDTNGKQKLYSCVAAEDIKEGIPYMKRETLLNLVWHEFGHSFVNPLTDKYADRVQKGQAADSLYKPIKSFMLRQGYVNWHICVNEFIIRAIGVRLFELNLGTEQAKVALGEELKQGFIYIEPLIAKLKEYEIKRDKDNITFSDFYPELLNVFDSLKQVEYWKNFDLSFKGPIYGALLDEKVAIIYPTQDLDTEALKIAQKQASDIFDFIKRFKENVLLLDDTKALNTDMKDYGILAYGTIESNLFLKRHAPAFPFRIENQTIYADKEYKDKNLKFITCVPNPYNDLKGMAIFTGISNKALEDINKPFTNGSLSFLDEDYVLFLNSDSVISKGFYKKDGKWQF